MATTITKSQRRKGLFTETSQIINVNTEWGLEMIWSNAFLLQVKNLVIWAVRGSSGVTDCAEYLRLLYVAFSKKSLVKIVIPTTNCSSKFAEVWGL